jgi:hypothetical protein
MLLEQGIEIRIAVEWSEIGTHSWSCPDKERRRKDLYVKLKKITTRRVNVGERDEVPPSTYAQRCDE